MSETLNFGPEWLRALSSGTGVTSPPPSPGIMQQFKLAEHRYGREEMLALYKKTEKAPGEVEEFQSIGRKECLTPMALTPLNDEEQRCLSQCVNSSVVLRLMGRGGGGAGPPSLRGGGARGTGRGRGRGRGDYQRSVSNYDDGDSGGFSRREFNRTLSWDEGNDHRLYDKSHRTDSSRPYDDAGPPSPRKHLERGSLSDNWRIPRERQLSRTEEEEDAGGWRQASRSGRSPRDNDDNWRTAAGSSRTNWHHPRERERPGFEDRERGREFTRPGENRERRFSGRTRLDSWQDESNEEMPEWTMDDDAFDNTDNIGTFDASGVFCSIKPEDMKKSDEKSSKEDKSGEDKESQLEKGDKPSAKEENHKPMLSMEFSSKPTSKNTSSSDSSISDNKMPPLSAISNAAVNTLSSNKFLTIEASKEARTSSAAPSVVAAEKQQQIEGAFQAQSLQDIEAQMLKLSSGKVNTVVTDSAKTPIAATIEAATSKADVSVQEQKLPESKVASGGGLSAEEEKNIAAILEDEDDGLEHLEKAAESLMAELIEEDDDKVPDIDVPTSKQALPLTHEHAQKWFYKDPQGQVQGPFLSSEMAEWFSAGYFTMNLLVKRGCDEEFMCLGDVIKRWGRVPFVQGPEPPPLAQKAAVSATAPVSSVPPSISPPVVVQAAIAAAQQPPQTQPPQVVQPNPQIAQLLSQVQAAAAAAVASQQQQQQQQQAQQQQAQQQQQQQQAMHQQQVFQQVLQQQQALIRVHASRIYSELVQRGQTLTPTQQQILRQQLITLQQQHQLLLKQQQQYQSLQQLSMGEGPPGTGDHPPSLTSHSQAAAAAAVAAAAAAAVQGVNQPPGTGKDVSKSVMENISMWGVPQKDRSEWDIGFWDPSMAKEIIEEERKFRELERLRKAEEHRKQVEQSAEEERQRLEEMRRQQEILRKEEQKKREEDSKRQEEMKKMEDDSGSKMEVTDHTAFRSLGDNEPTRQEDLKRQEEIRRLEDLQRADEERRQEEQRRIEQQRQEELRRQQEESTRKAQEEANRRAQEEANRRVQDEAAARRAQEEDAARRVQEEATQRRAREEQDKLRQEQERKDSERRQQELMRQQELQHQQDLQRQQQQEALRRLQQQQQQQSKLPSTAMWGQSTATTSTTPTTSSGGTPTLAHIQQLQAQQEERERDEQRQRQLAQLQQQQQQQQQQSQQGRPGWGSPNQGIPVSSVGGPTKSLREIQEEQARQQMERNKQQVKAQPNLTLASAASGVWGSSNSNTPMTWSNEAPSTWGNPQTTKAPMGFWDECARENTNPVLKTNSNNANFPALRGTAPSAIQQQQQQRQQQQQQQQQQTNANKSRSAKEEETVRKLFQSNMPSDEFTQWCEYMLQGMASSVDIPTFISFLQDVESPYEVHDYVKMYLGESRDTAEFARQFLERRNRQREQQREMDSNWIGQPSKEQGAPTGMGDWEEVNRSGSGVNNKKKKKGKQLVDPSILGFSVNAAERPNIGEIQTVDE